MDETLALPSEHAVTLALRTQQVLAHETGVTNTVDPLGGSYFIESLTQLMQQSARDAFRQIDEQGGMLAAIDNGYFRREIAESAFAEQQATDRGERIIVGVNVFQQAETQPLETQVMDEATEAEQVQSLQSVKQQRSPLVVRVALDKVRQAAESGVNVMPSLIEAAAVRVTLQEAVDALAEVFGRYRPPNRW
jgi:methylmalonyl-CoA mutase, N-terminal domain